jgi:hypothetical protein
MPIPQLFPRRFLTVAAILAGAALSVNASAQNHSSVEEPPPWTPLDVHLDPLVRMPGTQPGEASVAPPQDCLECHSKFDPISEPGRNWQGSMMAQAARDFLFWPALAVAAQDSIWAVGNPNATDTCLRCHMPKGWLEGRSQPTNGSAMTGADFDGVQCDLCHKMYDPFYEQTFSGTREGSDWLNYWDETNQTFPSSQLLSIATFFEDQHEAGTTSFFNGQPFYENDRPVPPNYTENASGQYFVDAGGGRRASFADAACPHTKLYSRYHKSKYFCGTCHDVSNPILANLNHAKVTPGDGTTLLPSEEQPAHSYFHVERTFSEFLLSDYGLQGGSKGLGPFAPGVFKTSLPGNFIARCQDCHMPDTS